MRPSRGHARFLLWARALDRSHAAEAPGLWKLWRSLMRATRRDDERADARTPWRRRTRALHTAYARKRRGR